MQILLDTDIGSDIDDAVCLAYLLANPDCELLGITTVSGQAEKRAQLASALCQAAGRSVPIFPGTMDPLIRKQRQPRAPQAAALGRWEHATNFPQGQAVQFLRETIRARPGQVTLLTIGPLTNVALLFSIDPEIPSLLKALVMMCGVFTNHPPGGGQLEWNALLDPHATAIVYKHAVKIHRSVGLDVTRRVTLPAAQVRQAFKSDLLRPVLDFAEIWFQERQTITFHDPLAATTLFDEKICRFERGRVRVELLDPELNGLTRWTPGSDGPHEAALDVDAERFFQHFFAVFE